ncbi:hypothetical protein N9850_13675 [Granulosicoccus sp.]|nr:hypothetical protein [Granulosicoccus sp.]MDB4224813.1 hypothetical protein [Granulosicoccus sp.]
MQADELGMAVAKVVEVLDRANIVSAVGQYRSSKGDQRSEAQIGLSQAAGILMEQFSSMKSYERQVTKSLHLDSLGSREYWLDLFGSVDDPKRHQGEIVRLASRVMFASNHLPGMLNLVKDASPTPQIAVQPIDQGDDYLCIRLTDAGERASDPDRVARSIDGIDMLYSACASIASKPAADIRIDSVIPKRNRDRDIVFAGERSSIAAVYGVISSISDALAELDPEQEINLDSVVQSLPVFKDLNTLASLGTFSTQDLKDISDTMHQGALLTLESGVIPLESSEVIVARDSKLPSGRPVEASGVSTEVPKLVSPVERDEHYDRYLIEREAMLRPQTSDGSDQGRQNQSIEVADELLKSLGQSRGR